MNLSPELLALLEARSAGTSTKLLINLWFLSIKYKWMFTKMRALAEWLNCYAFVPASAQKRNPRLNVAAFNYFHQDLMQAYYCTLAVEKNLTYEQQENLAALLEEETQNGPPTL